MRIVFCLFTLCFCSPALAYYAPYYYAPPPHNPAYGNADSQQDYVPPARDDNDTDSRGTSNPAPTYAAPYSPVSPASAAQALTVNWGDKDINWQDLQTLFMEHPQETVFIFRFPNGYNWRVTPEALRAFYTTIVGQASSMGLVGSADFSFSSVTQQLSVTCCVSQTAAPPSQ